MKGRIRAFIVDLIGAVLVFAIPLIFYIVTAT